MKKINNMVENSVKEYSQNYISDKDKSKLKKDIREAILNRDAYRKFIELVKAQGGHIYNVYMDWLGMSMDMPVLDEKVKYLKEIRAHQDGYIVSIDSRKIGEALVALGGGRNKKEDSIDYSVGFEFAKNSDKPTAIIARTHKGQGVSFMEDEAGWHGKAPNDEQLEQAVSELGGAL